MEFSTIETIIGYVASGMGITFLPRSILSRNFTTEQIDFHPLPSEVARVTTRFLRRKDSVESKTLSAFRAVVREFV